MKMFKLTDQDMRTYGGFQWRLGEMRRVENYTGVACGTGALHSYRDPLLAIFMNPIHGDISSPRLFEARTGVKVKSVELKWISEKLTLIKEIPVPEMTREQRVEISIRICKLLCKDANWNAWADKWLDGSDRSAWSAESAARSARAVAWSAAWSAESATWSAAESAAESSAESAARSAAESARSAARSAAESAAESAAKFERQVIAIIHQVVK